MFCLDSRRCCAPHVMMRFEKSIDLKESVSNYPKLQKLAHVSCLLKKNRGICLLPTSLNSHMFLHPPCMGSIHVPRTHSLTWCELGESFLTTIKSVTTISSLKVLVRANHVSYFIEGKQLSLMITRNS
jgi:hypothetical protein